MQQWLEDKLYRIQIVVLMAFAPTKLFNKLNQLDWYQNTLHQWVNQHHFKPNIHILEAGCETGSLCEFLAESGHMVTGIDLSAKMIQQAEQLKHQDINYQISSVHHLPFKNETFDAVISASLLNIIPNQQQAIDEMFRVCKKGGTVSILAPIQGFDTHDLERLSSSLAIHKFSKAALKTWWQFPPKMNPTFITTLLKQAGLHTAAPVQYLNGMVASVSGVKPS